MPTHSKTQVLDTIADEGVVPVFYDADVDLVTEVANVLVRGGITTFEFTNRGDGAISVLELLLRHAGRSLPQLIVGVGSIVDGGTAAHVIDLGANFVFGPSFSPGVAKACNLRNVPYVPGCGTMTEVLTAYEAGCDFVKLFPAGSLGGPGFLDALRAPCPWVRAIPTGGVEPTVESLRGWYQAGAPAVGMGSKLIPRRMVAEGDFDALRALIDVTVASVAEARS